MLVPTEVRTVKKWSPQIVILALMVFMGIGSIALVLVADIPWGTPSDKYADVQLILDRNCSSCHNGATAAGKVRTTTYLDLVKGKSPVVIPYDVQKSKLSQVVHPGARMRMPPGGSLSRKQIAIIDAWIKAGVRP